MKDEFEIENIDLYGKIAETQTALAEARTALEQFYAGEITQKEYEEKIVTIAEEYDGELLT